MTPLEKTEPSNESRSAADASSEEAPRAGWIWPYPLAVLLPIGVALAASSMLLVDYLRPLPLFCEAGGGCDAVRRSAFASWLGIPTPALGLAAFTLLVPFALVRGGRMRLAHAALGLLIGAASLGLVGVQIALHAFCKYCLVVDAMGIAVAAGGIVRLKGIVGPAKWNAALSAPLALLAIGPLAYGLGHKAVAVPRAVAEEIRKTPRGIVTVVDFVDYECPFCRRAHQNLAPVLAAHHADVRLVRKEVPLRMHLRARPAARAECCAERLGQGDAMADALMSAPLDDVTVDGCEALAAKLGLDAEKFRACVSDPQTDAKIDADTAEFRATGAKGLPTIWIGTHVFEGVAEKADYEKAIAEARGGA